MSVFWSNACASQKRGAVEQLPVLVFLIFLIAPAPTAVTELAALNGERDGHPPPHQRLGCIGTLSMKTMMGKEIGTRCEVVFVLGDVLVGYERRFCGSGSLIKGSKGAESFYASHVKKNSAPRKKNGASQKKNAAQPKNDSASLVLIHLSRFPGSLRVLNEAQCFVARLFSSFFR